MEAAWCSIIQFWHLLHYFNIDQLLGCLEVSTQYCILSLNWAVLAEVLGNEVMARIALHADSTNVWTYNNMIVHILCCCTPCWISDTHHPFCSLADGISQPVIFHAGDGCHMWGRKCSLFPEHLISLPFIIYTCRICQSKDYVYGLMTLVCWPGLVLTALSWNYIILPPSSQWLIGNKAIPSQKDTHIWCTEFKFPDLSSRGLQSGLHEHPSFFVCSLRVDYMYQNSYWLNDTRMVYAWSSKWFKRNNVLKWNVMLKIHIYIFLRVQYVEWTHHWVWISSWKCGTLYQSIIQYLKHSDWH